jgi:hypothetical protein
VARSDGSGEKSDFGHSFARAASLQLSLDLVEGCEIQQGQVKIF